MKQIEKSDRVSLEPSVSATAAVVWMHGLGADGHDFVPLVGALGLASDCSWRFVFPHAPVKPVTINGGVAMPSWFDILSLDRFGPQDVAGIRRSQARIDGLIKEQTDTGIPSERVLIAGFSQGGAIALHTALRYPAPLAGVMGLSTYLPMESTVEAEGSTANRGIPILMQHGTFDPVLPLSLGSISRDRLRAAGYGVGWNEYPMQHEVCNAEMGVIAAFLHDRLD